MGSQLEEANTYTEDFIDWCSSHPDITILDCAGFSDTEFEYCVRSVGVWGNLLGCMDSDDCKVAFAASHIEDCDSFRNQKEILLGMFNLIYTYSKFVKNCSHLVVEVNPRHVKFYECILGFTPVAESASCPRLRRAAAAT